VRQLLYGLAALAMLLWQVQSLAVEPTTSQAWIRVLPGDLPLAGYLVLTNPGERTLTLVGAHSPAFREIEMHKSVDQSGVARMMMVKRVAIAPGGRLVFGPGGYHLMLFDRTRVLQAGDEVPITLEFADGERLTVPFALRAATAR